ncbi:acetoin utilization AcuB family protein [Thalassobacillus sp. CUG 92003]|uniref:acetoin utilization AcuB family protein n=1 Tax=Thalassobacillus sp. CUG 92003 TaxID=2736641 RepID=UPI0015E729A4|nr:acetoin utilization AcuB family protein [Thalassobacillus sp. CUG 92003]
MLIEEMMRTDIIKLKADDSIENALKLLNDYHIRHIPIVDDDNKVVGIVSDRDVRDASPSIFDRQSGANALKNDIQSIMSSPVITVHPLDFVEEVAAIFYDNEIACVPVTRENKLIGMITEKDLLYTLIQLTGTHEQGSQIEIKVIDRPGILPEVTQIFGKRKMNINSVLIYPYKPDKKFKILVFRIQTMNPKPTITDLQSAGYEVLWPNLPGMSL